MLAMEKDFDSKLGITEERNVGNKISGGSSDVQRSKSFAFRAPQENFTIMDFELGKIYGVGSYSKVECQMGFKRSHRNAGNPSPSNQNCFF